MVVHAILQTLQYDTVEEIYMILYKYIYIVYISFNVNVTNILYLYLPISTFLGCLKYMYT